MEQRSASLNNMCSDRHRCVCLHKCAGYFSYKYKSWSYMVSMHTAVPLHRVASRCRCHSHRRMPLRFSSSMLPHLHFLIANATLIVASTSSFIDSSDLNATIRSRCPPTPSACPPASGFWLSPLVYTRIHRSTTPALPWR
jgi:hypothetical protein